jgi:hypothetical protein
MFFVPLSNPDPTCCGRLLENSEKSSNPLGIPAAAAASLAWSIPPSLLALRGL